MSYREDVPIRTVKALGPIPVVLHIERSVTPVAALYALYVVQGTTRIRLSNWIESLDEINRFRQQMADLLIPFNHKAPE